MSEIIPTVIDWSAIITCPKCGSQIGVDRKPGTHYLLIHETDGSHTFEARPEYTRDERPEPFIETARMWEATE